MAEELILAIDAGTQSIRAGLVDRHGTMHHFVKHAIEPYIQGDAGRAEQDPEYYWNELCSVTKELLASINSETIAAVTLTTQRMTMLILDEQGQPLDNAITWLDTRKADYKRVLPWWLKAGVRIAGLSRLVHFATGQARLNWWSQNRPDLWKQTKHYSFLSGFFSYRLTSEFKDSVGNMIGTLPFNVKKSTWCSPLDIKWKIFPISEDILPKLVEQTKLQGRITSWAAEQTGIPEGTPLIAASNDKACDLLGAGCRTADVAAISLGTTATINVHTDKYVELKPLFPPFPSAEPGGFYTEVSVTRGLWMVSWFKEEFGLQERLGEHETGVAAEILLEELIKEIPSGSMGLMVQPHWTAGPNDEPFTKGAVIGFGDIHTRAHLYRAILEGIIYAMREGAELTQKRTKVKINRIHATGGGSKSDVMMQMIADVLGVPTYRTRTPETSVIGAAIDAAVGIGWYPSIDEAAASMVHIQDEFLPLEDNRRVYDQLYSKVYLKIYPTMLEMNKNIQTITGYPSL